MKQAHRGYTIVRNEYGYFNVPAINCWASPTIDSAIKAIDAHLTRGHLFCAYCGLTGGTVEAANPDGICCEVELTECGLCGESHEDHRPATDLSPAFCMSRDSRPGDRFVRGRQ